MAAGRLILVGTPIGNLGDLSPRAIETLADADVIACEDTRRTGRLLKHVGIEKRRLITVNEHTEYEQIESILGEVAAGAVIALVSDAGMPGVSDPGERLVAAATGRGIAVETVPGPSSVLAALVISGLPGGRFCFEGFLPRKGRVRQDRLAQLVTEQRTVVLFEAPHRLERTLDDLRERAGDDRRVVLARELTKLHEEVWRGTLADAVLWCAEQAKIRGEFVVVLDGASPPAMLDDGEITIALVAAIESGSSRRDAIAEVASTLGVAKRRAYSLALDLDR